MLLNITSCLEQWFLTFFYIFYQTRLADLPQYTHWCSFIENRKLSTLTVWNDL